MNRRMIIAILCSLIFVFFALSATPVFAQDAAPGDGDAVDQAYLAEYEQRAVETYASLLATQAAKKAAVKAAARPEYADVMFLTEYEQRARDAYAAVRRPSSSAVVQSTPDWGGEIFLAEYGQRAQDGYRRWLASRDDANDQRAIDVSD